MDDDLATMPPPVTRQPRVLAYPFYSSTDAALRIVHLCFTTGKVATWHAEQCPKQHYGMSRPYICYRSLWGENVEKDTKLDASDCAEARTRWTGHYGKLEL